MCSPEYSDVFFFEGKLNKKGTTSRKALYEALQDVAAHIVVEADGLAQASKISLSALVKAVESQGLTFLKGNRERVKLEGESGTFVYNLCRKWRTLPAGTCTSQQHKEPSYRATSRARSYSTSTAKRCKSNSTL